MADACCPNCHHPVSLGDSPDDLLDALVALELAYSTMNEANGRRTAALQLGNVEGLREANDLWQRCWSNLGDRILGVLMAGSSLKTELGMHQDLLDAFAARKEAGGQ